MAKKKNTAPMLATVVGGSLFIKEAPDIKSGCIGLLDNGEQIEVLAVKGRYAQIDRGYVMTEFLDMPEQGADKE